MNREFYFKQTRMEGKKFASGPSYLIPFYIDESNLLDRGVDELATSLSDHHSWTTLASNAKKYFPDVDDEKNPLQLTFIGKLLNCFTFFALSYKDLYIVYFPFY